ncbi:hypothetical protein [Mycobacterium basiliense]|uniref:hypothetical protein n=1 Tax=Mycobacterium basiliense TaxID=2094119 RepID=UPI001E559D67|nr:hypothetical protein [Mycobacterium basiliense]
MIDPRACAGAPVAWAPLTPTFMQVKALADSSGRRPGRRGPDEYTVHGRVNDQANGLQR